MKRLAFAIVAAALAAGCDSSASRSAKPEYAFEVVAFGEHMDIVRVTNTKTGRSLKVMRYGSNGLITLPGEF